MPKADRSRDIGRSNSPPFRPIRWAAGWATLLAPAALFAGLSLSAQLAAQEITALQAAAAIENALTAAIAQSDKSVVAIARVTHRDELGTLEPRIDPFGRIRVSPPRPRPEDADFVPDDFASGVIIDRRGLILTNYHVLGEESDYYVTTAERKVYPARVRAADPRSDLAVLSIDGRDLPAIKFGDASNLKKGQIVIALGNPYAIARDGQASASWGIIANFERKRRRALTTIPSRARARCTSWAR